MDQGAPWRTIQRLQRSFLLTELVFLVGCISAVSILPENQVERGLFTIWIVLVPIALALLFWPAPCPKCGSPFLLFSLLNLDKAVALLFKSFFNPFRYVMAFLSPSCPHCSLPYLEDPPPGGWDRPS